MPRHTTITSSLLTIVFALCAACSSTPRANTNNASSDLKVVHFTDINWTPLNPARGDNSPRAGTLWGDRSADVATGFLVQFKDGFSSPPHIHNVTYKGIVISGLIHNDDPSAAKMWMPPVSYWTQPQGEAHITAAQGDTNIAYIEIDEGPYLVRPTDQAYDNGQRPINIDASNIVWIDATNGAQIAYLWASQSSAHPSGTLIKLPHNFQGTLDTDNTPVKAVVIQGQLKLRTKSNPSETTLSTASYFQTSNTRPIHLINNSEQDTILYLRTTGKVQLRR